MVDVTACGADRCVFAGKCASSRGTIASTTSVRCSHASSPTERIRHPFACRDDERPLYYEDIVPMQVLTKHATDYIQMQDEHIGTTSATRRASRGRPRGRSSDLLPNMLKPTNAARKKILHNGCSVATIAKFK